MCRAVGEAHSRGLSLLVGANQGILYDRMATLCPQTPSRCRSVPEFPNQTGFLPFHKGQVGRLWTATDMGRRDLAKAVTVKVTGVHWRPLTGLNVPLSLQGYSCTCLPSPGPERGWGGYGATSGEGDKPCCCLLFTQGCRVSQCLPQFGNIIRYLIIL